MIAHVCASTGWTWDYVLENFDLPRVKELNDYWRRHPPVHILAAAYTGFKAPDAAQMEADDAEALAAFGGTVLSADEFDALLKEKGLV